MPAGKSGDATARGGPEVDRVRAVRRFSRWYTKQIGLLDEGYLQSSFSLTQVRVLYELAHRAEPTAGELSKDLGIDPAYMSRILREFLRRGLVDRRASEIDGRHQLLQLTAQGQAAFAPLDARSHDQVRAMLQKFTSKEQERLVAAMSDIEEILGAQAEATIPYLLRPHRPGDIGWVVQRHGELYAQEYGWDASFEALVASIVAKFIDNYEPARERCWIAEMEGQRVGSVFCVRRSATVAQLRLLLVEPQARGLGIGRRLVEECLQFARSVGYRKVTLWTNDVLVGARRIYERAGFQLVAEEQHHSFGHDLVGQNWERRL